MNRERIFTAVAMAIRTSPLMRVCQQQNINATRISFDGGQRASDVLFCFCVSVHNIDSTLLPEEHNCSHF